MRFFSERKRKKLLSELKSRRHAEDDLLSSALRSQFDAVIGDLEKASEEDLDSVISKSREKINAMPLARRGIIYTILDLILVVGAVAFGLRGLFFQPFRIPTGSMQPTLFGIHYQKVENNANPFFGQLPDVLHSIVFGTSAARAVNGNISGMVDSLELMPGSIFDKTVMSVGKSRFVLPGTPGMVADYANLYEKNFFAAGETVCDGFVSLGDHLFVERVSMYLTPLRRGDIIVFNTEGLRVNGTALASSSGYYYIKRLAALPGDTVKISADQLYVKPRGESEFRKIQDIDSRFEKIYSGLGGYHGHLGGFGCEPFVLDNKEYTIAEDHYLMLGDNSRFSMDSRYFGPVPRKNLIGRAWLIFYPFSRRAGIADSVGPLNETTGKAGFSTFPVMYQQ